MPVRRRLARRRVLKRSPVSLEDALDEDVLPVIARYVDAACDLQALCSASKTWRRAVPASRVTDALRAHLWSAIPQALPLEEWTDYEWQTTDVPTALETRRRTAIAHPAPVRYLGKNWLRKDSIVLHVSPSAMLEADGSRRTTITYFPPEEDDSSLACTRRPRFFVALSRVPYLHDLAVQGVEHVDPSELPEGEGLWVSDEPHRVAHTRLATRMRICATAAGGRVRIAWTVGIHGWAPSSVRECDIFRAGPGGLTLRCRGADVTWYGIRVSVP